MIDVDITRSGPFGNPFPMGLFGSNSARRREVVVLHERWLTGDPTTPAGDMRLSDRSDLAHTVRPRGTYWKERCALDVLSSLEDLARAHPNAQAFRLCCSSSCRGNLCHGTALASEFRAFLRSDCV